MSGAGWLTSRILQEIYYKNNSSVDRYVEQIIYVPELTSYT